MDLSTSFSTKALAAVRPRRRTLRLAVRWLIVLAFIAILGAVGSSYYSRPTSVMAARAVRGPVADVVYATGFVEPRRPVDVSSRVTAPVTAVLADEGDRVRRGQALVTLDAEDQRESIAQLSADRIKTEQDEGRALALFQQGWIARAGRDQAVASANAARAAEASARAKLDQYTIRSGISGVILRRDVEPGDLATAAKTLFEIGDPKQLRITATVDERDIPLVRTGSKVMMSTEAYPGRILRGAVYEITPGGDPDQRAFRVRIRPDASFQLPVGLTVEVNIMVSKRDRALLVPGSAVREGSVWIIVDGRARKAAVKIGIRSSDRIEVLDGVLDQTCVIADPPATLKEGQRVSAKGC